MLLVLVSLLTASAAPTFSFVGQPDCVQVQWDGERTRLENNCEAAILVDQSVQLDVEGQSNGLVLPGATTHVRDLSAFSLGMNGEIYRVIAVIEEPEPKPEGKATADTGLIE